MKSIDQLSEQLGVTHQFLKLQIKNNTLRYSFPRSLFSGMKLITFDETDSFSIEEMQDISLYKRLRGISGSELPDYIYVSELELPVTLMPPKALGHWQEQPIKQMLFQLFDGTDIQTFMPDGFPTFIEIGILTPDLLLSEAYFSDEEIERFAQFLPSIKDPEAIPFFIRPQKCDFACEAIIDFGNNFVREHGHPPVGPLKLWKYMAAGSRFGWEIETSNPSTGERLLIVEGEELTTEKFKKRYQNYVNREHKRR